MQILSRVNGRHLIFVPEINPATFVFFYAKGERSYSVRDYANPPVESVRYADEFPYTASEICRMATRTGNHFFEAERHNTRDLEFWHQAILRLNERFLPWRTIAAPSPCLGAVAAPAFEAQYPLLNPTELVRSAKAAKRQDLQRIFQSRNSEDYVTWNVFQLLRQREGWWGAWVDLARSKNPLAVEAVAAEDEPDIRLWQLVSTPHAYEKASRQRMAASGIPQWITRAADPSVVEGDSEIDVVLAGKELLIFIEAKLGSDISTRTKYDPNRNQIVRNIDCLIEDAGRCIPSFWMITRDDAPSRAYMQLVNAYRTDARSLALALPHRDGSVIAQIASRMTLFLWKELMGLLRRPDGPDEQRVWHEVWSRIQ